MPHDKATQIIHQLTDGTRLVSGQSIPQGASLASFIANAAGQAIDSPSGNRTWDYNLLSGREVWGPEGSDALDTSVTRPDPTAKTMSVNVINVKPGDRLFVNVTGTGSLGEKLDNLDGSNVYFDLTPGAAPANKAGSLAKLEANINARFDKIEAKLDSALAR